MSEYHVKQIIRDILPPVAFRNLKYFYNVILRNKTIYRPRVCNVPDNFVDEIINPWDSINWLKHSEKGLIDSLSGKIQINPHIKQLIFALNSLRISGNNPSVDIYDIGGGCGIYYTLLLASGSLKNINLRYLVVDSKCNILIGKDKLGEDKIICFIDSYEDWIAYSSKINQESTIINLSGVLQYIMDWRAYLAYIIENIAPKYIVISRFPISIDAEFEGYAIQDISTPYGYCGSARVVLFKDQDLEIFMSSKGFFKCSEHIGNLQNYFTHGCSDSSFKNIQLNAYYFART